MASAATLELQIRAINQATAELQKLARDLRGLQQASVTAGAAARGLELNWKGIGRTAAAVALGMGGLSLSITGTKTALFSTIGAAIQFESSFAGIRKTMDATEEEFARIAQANRQMAKEIPLSVNEINRIGELAGQLGVRGADNLVKFERTVADLANTTNLTADEAAVAFAQIANVMQLPISDIDRLGASVVDLGNNFATTERDIVAFSQRIAGAARIAGLSAADVAGIATAFSSIGVEAEAGGTAVQKVLIDIRTAATTANDDLAVFARTAGMTADEFSRLARSDPAEAFVAFVEGLGRAGDDAVRILQELGLEDQRLIRAFLGVANAGDLLRRAVQTSTDAYRENTALTAEAEKRYGTLQSQLLILRNRALDVGISFGQALAPGIASAAGAAGTFLQHLQPLAPVLGAVARELPLVAAAAAAVGVAMAGLKLGAFIGEWQLLGRVLLAEVGAIGAVRTALSGLAAAIMTPTGALLALSAALVAVDVGLRAFTGAGLIDQLTGAASAAKRAREEQERYNLSLEIYNELIRQGKTEEEARAARLADIGRQAQQLREEQRQRVQEMAREFQELTGRQPSPAVFEKMGQVAREETAPAFRLLNAETKALNPSVAELQTLFGRFPELKEPLSRTLQEAVDREVRLKAATEQATPALTQLRKALDLPPDAAISLDRVTTSMGAAGEEADDLGKRLKDLVSAYRELTTAADEFTTLLMAPRDAERAALEAQRADLEAERIRLQQLGLPTEGLDEALEHVNLQLRAIDASSAQVDARIRLLAANLRDYFQQQGMSFRQASELAEEGISRIALAVAQLPAEKQIHVATELDQLRKAEVIGLIRFLEDYPTIPIDVAIRIVEAPVIGRFPADVIRRKIEATGFAQGGVVDRPTIALLGEREREYVIPESKLPKLQGGAGVGRFQGILEAYFRAAAAGAAARGSAALHPLVELKRQLDAAGMSVERFAAALELIQEREEAARRAAEEAARARIELEKLSIVLGQAGVSGEAFRTQVALLEVRRAFAQAGAEMDDLALQIVSAAQNLDRDLLQRIESLRERAAELARKTGRPAFIIETGPEGVVIGNTRFAASGVLTEEGVRRTLERRPEFAPFIHQIEENGRTPAENLRALAEAFKSFNGTIEEFREKLESARNLREALRRLPDLRGLSEALKKVAEPPPAAPRDTWESSLVRDPRTGELVRQWVRNTNYYGPVTIHSRAGVTEALDALSLGVR